MKSLGTRILQALRADLFDNKLMSKAVFILIIASTRLAMVGCLYMGKEQSSPLRTVPYVDLSRYTGG
jgi:hypothetical protein